VPRSSPKAAQTNGLDTYVEVTIEIMLYTYAHFHKDVELAKESSRKHGGAWGLEGKALCL